MGSLSVPPHPHEPQPGEPSISRGGLLCVVIFIGLAAVIFTAVMPTPASPSSPGGEPAMPHLPLTYPKTRTVTASRIHFLANKPSPIPIAGWKTARRPPGSAGLARSSAEQTRAQLSRCRAQSRRAPKSVTASSFISTPSQPPSARGELLFLHEAQGQRGKSGALLASRG